MSVTSNAACNMGIEASTAPLQDFDGVDRGDEPRGVHGVYGSAHSEDHPRRRWRARLPARQRDRGGLGAGAGAAADFLENNSADIDDSETLLVSTVHRAKGSEHKHVAVEKSIVMSDEREVHYVATTRHKSVLFVISLD